MIQELNTAKARTNKDIPEDGIRRSRRVMDGYIAAWY
jgi:hypothetical protein